MPPATYFFFFFLSFLVPTIWKSQLSLIQESDLGLIPAGWTGGRCGFISVPVSQLHLLVWYK